MIPSKEEVEAFWGLVGEVRLVLEAAKEREHEHGHGEAEEVMRDLRDVVESRTWDIRALRSAMNALKERLGLGDIVGFESVIG